MASRIVYAGSSRGTIVLSAKARSENRRAQRAASQQPPLDTPLPPSDPTVEKYTAQVADIDERISAIRARQDEIYAEIQSLPREPEYRGQRNRLFNEDASLTAQRNRLTRDRQEALRDLRRARGQYVKSRREIAEEKGLPFSSPESRQAQLLGIKPEAIGKVSLTTSDVLKGGALDRAFQARRAKAIREYPKNAGIATMTNASGRQVAIASVDLGLESNRVMREQKAQTIAALEGRRVQYPQSREGQGGILSIDGVDAASIDLSLYAKQRQKEQRAFTVAQLTGTAPTLQTLDREPSLPTTGLWATLNRKVAEKTTYKISDPFDVAAQKELTKATQRYQKSIAGIDPSLLAASPVARKQDYNAPKGTPYYVAKGFSDYFRERPVSVGLFAASTFFGGELLAGVRAGAGAIRTTRFGQTAIGAALTSRRAGIAAEAALGVGFIGSEAYEVARQPSGKYRAYAVGGVTARVSALGGGVASRKLTNKVIADVGTLRWQNKLAISDAALREPIPYVQDIPFAIERPVPSRVFAGRSTPKVEYGVDLNTRLVREEIPYFGTRKTTFGGYETDIPDIGGAYARAIAARRGGAIGTSFQTSLRSSIYDPVTSRSISRAEADAIIGRFKARSSGQTTLQQFGIDYPIPEYARGVLGSGPAKSTGYQRSLIEYTPPRDLLRLTGPEPPSPYPFYQRRFNLFGRNIFVSQSGSETSFRLGTFGAGGRGQTSAFGLRFEQPKIYERSPSYLRVERFEPTIPDTPSLKPSRISGGLFDAFKGARRPRIFTGEIPKTTQKSLLGNLGVATSIQDTRGIFGQITSPSNNVGIRQTTNTRDLFDTQSIQISVPRTVTGFGFDTPPPAPERPSSRGTGGGRSTGRGSDFIVGGLLPIPLIGAASGGFGRPKRGKKRKYKTSRSALNVVFGVKGIDPFSRDITGLFTRG